MTRADERIITEQYSGELADLVDQHANTKALTYWNAHPCNARDDADYVNGFDQTPLDGEA